MKEHFTNIKELNEKELTGIQGGGVKEVAVIGAITVLGGSIAGLFALGV